MLLLRNALLKRIGNTDKKAQRLVLCACTTDVLFEFCAAWKQLPPRGICTSAGRTLVPGSRCGEPWRGRIVQRSTHDGLCCVVCVAGCSFPSPSSDPQLDRSHPAGDFFILFSLFFYSAVNQQPAIPNQNTCTGVCKIVVKSVKTFNFVNLLFCPDWHTGDNSNDTFGKRADKQPRRNYKHYAK